MFAFLQRWICVNMYANIWSLSLASKVLCLLCWKGKCQIFWKNVSLDVPGRCLKSPKCYFGSANHSCRWRWYLQCSSFLKKIVEQGVRILRCTPPKLTVEKWMLFTLIGILVSSLCQLKMLKILLYPDHWHNRWIILLIYLLRSSI